MENLLVIKCNNHVWSSTERKSILTRAVKLYLEKRRKDLSNEKSKEDNTPEEISTSDSDNMTPMMMTMRILLCYQKKTMFNEQFCYYVLSEKQNVSVTQNHFFVNPTSQPVPVLSRFFFT